MPTWNYLPLVVRGQNRATRVRERVPMSPKYSFDQKTKRCTSEYFIEWDQVNENIPQAALDFLGYSVPTGAHNLVTGISRIIPYPHPNFPNTLYAEALKQIGGSVAQGKDARDVAHYDEAEVSVEFSSPSCKFLTDDELAASTVLNKNYDPIPNNIGEAALLRYVTIEAETCGRYEKVPAGGSVMKWFSDSAPMTSTSAVILCEGDLTITYHQIPIDAIPWDAINNCVGCCDGDIVPGGASKTFAHSSYLGPIFQKLRQRRIEPAFICLSPKFSKPYPMANDAYAVDIIYRFKYYPNGANHFYRWDKGRFEYAYRGPEIQPVVTRGFFPEASFNTLFWGPDHRPP